VPYCTNHSQLTFFSRAVCFASSTLAFTTCSRPEAYVRSCMTTAGVQFPHEHQAESYTLGKVANSVQPVYSQTGLGKLTRPDDHTRHVSSMLMFHSKLQIAFADSGMRQPYLGCCCGCSAAQAIQVVTGSYTPYLHTACIDLIQAMQSKMVWKVYYQYQIHVCLSACQGTLSAGLVLEWSLTASM